MKTIWRYLLAGVILRFSKKRTVRRDRELPASAKAETWTAMLLFAASLAALAFVAIYAFADANTQLLGLSIAVALALIAAALILAASQVVPQETLEEPRPDFAQPDHDVDGPKTRHIGKFSAHQPEEEAALTVREGGDGVTRRKLLGTAGAAAGVGLGAAALVPLASLGPAVGDRLAESPWKDGVRLVEENGMAVKASDLEVGSFLTAFAEGADKEGLATSLAVVRVRPAGGTAVEVGRFSIGENGSYQFDVVRALGPSPGGSAEVEVSVIDRGGGSPPSGAALSIGRAQIVTR